MSYNFAKHRKWKKSFFFFFSSLHQSPIRSSSEENSRTFNPKGRENNCRLSLPFPLSSEQEVLLGKGLDSLPTHKAVQSVTHACSEEEVHQGARWQVTRTRQRGSVWIEEKINLFAIIERRWESIFFFRPCCFYIFFSFSFQWISISRLSFCL